MGGGNGREGPGAKRRATETACERESAASGGRRRREAAEESTAQCLVGLGDRQM
jgi:hypothetical protein